MTKNLQIPFTSDETIRNLSSYKSTEEEAEISKYGSKHPIEPKHLLKTDILATFERIHRSLSRDLKDERKSGELIVTITNLANVYWSSYKPTQNTLRKHGILKKLTTRKDIVTVRPNKGSGVVILDRDICDRKVLKIINDTTKFKKLKDNPTLTREGQLQRFLKKIKDKNLFDENTYKKIYPCGSKPATIYGLPKTHKISFDSEDSSLRPIISSIGTYYYNLAKFLTELLDPFISKEHCAKDLFGFCEEIQQVSSNDNFLVSYNVCSLFTSIPCKK